MKSITFVFILLIIKINCEVNCPSECFCSQTLDLVKVDCSGLGLTYLPDLTGLNVYDLDLSNNNFNAIPDELSTLTSLEVLDLSSNHIFKIQENFLEQLTSLQSLYLQNNNISNWIDISPNTLLLPALRLDYLSLAENPFTSFSNNDEEFILVSSTLKWLDLSNCRIAKVGYFILQGLTNLEHLMLGGNPIREIPDIKSDSLLSLDLSNTKLTTLQNSVFAYLPSLSYVNLSKNHRLALVGKTDQVESESVKRLDLSYCNMDNIEIDGFPNLITVVLRGNMIRQLDKQSFISNKYLENIDLSYNAIRQMNSNSFRGLKHLKQLDLSFNMIPKIEKDIFKNNNVLTSLNLSRNYIARFNQFVAKSLTHLNMSWCEIANIDSDALNQMPEVSDIDLSNNLISNIPDGLNSETLQVLDLSMCRITSIRNTTFKFFPEIFTISLSGNRLTTTFRSSFFDDNLYLREISLGDNPWICDCTDTGFFNFYQHFMTPIPRIRDTSHTRCTTPEALYGQTWERACWNNWYNSDRSLGTAEKIWTILMISIILLSGSVCIIMSIKKCIEGRKLTRNEEERLAYLDEQRDLMRENRMRMEQTAQLNAPDPRESCPPCYEDALLMPRLTASLANLSELAKKRARKFMNKDEEESDDDVVVTRRCRCRSEEVLSMRETRPPTFLEQRQTVRIPIDLDIIESAPEDRANRVRSEMIGDPQVFQSNENSPYSKRKKQRHSISEISTQQNGNTSPNGVRLSSF